MISKKRTNRLLMMSWAISLLILLAGCQITLLDGDQIKPADQSAAAATANADTDGADAGDSDADVTDAGDTDAGDTDAENSTAQDDSASQQVDAAALADYDEIYDEAYAASEFVDVPLNERVINTVFGEMAWFESETNDYAILRPEQWDEISPEQCSSPGATVCYVGGPGGMIITEESLTQLPREVRNRDGYIDFLFEIFGDDSDFEIQQFAESQTAQGDPVDIFTVTNPDEDVVLDRFIFVDEDNGVAFSATIFLNAEMHETLAPAVSYIQESFRFWPDEDRSESAIHHLDEGRWLTANDDFGAAIVAFSRALEQDPDLRIAVQSRGWLYQQEKQFERALADFNRVIEISPALGGAYHDRGLIYYLMHDYEEALVDLEKAIELEPENPSHNNLRALIYAVNDEPESALPDMEDALQKSGGELPIHIQDTRGFVYLMMGDFEKAKVDYDAIFSQEEQFGHALLGAGIAYVEVGEVENGIALIEAGMAEFEDDELADPEPQLGALLELAEEILGDAP